MFIKKVLFLFLICYVSNFSSASASQTSGHLNDNSIEENMDKSSENNVGPIYAVAFYYPARPDQEDALKIYKISSISQLDNYLGFHLDHIKSINEENWQCLVYSINRKLFKTIDLHSTAIFKLSNNPLSVKGPDSPPVPLPLPIPIPYAQLNKSNIFDIIPEKYKSDFVLRDTDQKSKKNREIHIHFNEWFDDVAVQVTQGRFSDLEPLFEPCESLIYRYDNSH